LLRVCSIGGALVTSAVASPAAAQPAPRAASTAEPAAVDARQSEHAPSASPLEAGAVAYAPDEQRLMDKHPLDNGKSHVKPGTGFVFQSEDGDFSFAPRLRAQVLYSLQKAESEDMSQSVQLRRARLQFKGNYYGADNKFKVELALSPGDTGMSDGEGPTTSALLDWYFDFEQLRDLSLRVGQYKVPHSRQRVVSSGDLELVDRSIINAEFNLDRDIGIDLRSEDLFGLGLLRYYAGIYGGEGRNTRGFYDLGMMYLARVELLPFGMFDDYQEMDFERLASPRLSLGVGAAHLANARRNQGILGDAPSDGGTTDINSFTWDAVFRYAGLSVTTEWLMRDATRAPGPDGEEEAPRNGIGGMVQVSYLLPWTRIGVAARGALIRPDDGNTSLGEQDEYGGGVSYYFAQHPFKLQADYFRIGEEAEPSEMAYVHQVRVQFQGSY
jgi:hypothetical protein